MYIYIQTQSLKKFLHASFYNSQTPNSKTKLKLYPYLQ